MVMNINHYSFKIATYLQVLLDPYINLSYLSYHHHYVLMVFCFLDELQVVEILNFVIIMLAHFYRYFNFKLFTKATLKQCLKASSFAIITLKSLTFTIYSRKVTKHQIQQMGSHLMVQCVSIHFNFQKILINIVI